MDNNEDAILALSKVQVLNIFKKLITNVRLQTLGIPEMDIFTHEVMNRSVALWVHEPRVPGTYHWITGMYNILGLTHTIDSNGYKTNMRLTRKLPDTQEEMNAYTLLTGHRWGDA